MKPPKSVAEYLKNSGWSSHHFLDHAKRLLADHDIKTLCELELHRTVLYFKLHGATALKAYVHHNGRSSEYLTFTDAKGTELATFHHSRPYDLIKRFILQCLKV